jgi:hypothetical protein
MDINEYLREVAEGLSDIGIAHDEDQRRRQAVGA